MGVGPADRVGFYVYSRHAIYHSRYRVDPDTSSETSQKTSQETGRGGLVGRDRVVGNLVDDVA